MKKLLLIPAVIFLVAVATVLLVSLQPSGNPKIAMPDPNGYDTLIKAASVVIPPREGGSVHSLAGEQLRNYVQDNTTAASLIEEALEQECRIVHVFNGRQLVSPIPKLKELALLLQKAGELAEEMEDFDLASERYLQIVTLGVKGTQGGILIERHFGIACEAIGITSLNGTRHNLEPTKCREITRLLRALRDQADSANETLLNEQVRMRKTSNTAELFIFEFAKHFPNSAYKKMESSFRQKATTGAETLQACIAAFEEQAAELEDQKQPSE